MINDQERNGLELRSLVRPGELQVSLERVAIPRPGPAEVVVRVEAAPINPSDLGLLFGAADLGSATHSESNNLPQLTMRIPDAAMSSMAGRLGKSLPVGNEGAGVVIEAGSSAGAQALLGKVVSVLAGAMYSQYRCVSVEQCLALPEGHTPADGASVFVNPLTVLGFVETLRREGHKALVHTAAASNLGQMLIRVCTADGIPLVNIVRKPEQAELLRKLGARYVCNSESPTFLQELTEAIVATEATLAFDAIGGGKLAGQILGCMEAAANRNAKEYSRYGSTVHKQVYIYGALDPSPTELRRNFGMAWGIGGWLVFPYLQKLQKLGADTQTLKARVLAELKTTFASRYAKEVSLYEALRPEEIAVYAARATGDKYLVNPSKPIA